MLEVPEGGGGVLHGVGQLGQLGQQVGQPGVTELLAGAEGEGGEPGQAAGQEQQAGVGDAAPGVAA